MTKASVNSSWNYHLLIESASASLKLLNQTSVKLQIPSPSQTLSDLKFQFWLFCRYWNWIVVFDKLLLSMGRTWQLRVRGITIGYWFYFYAHQLIQSPKNSQKFLAPFDLTDMKFRWFPRNNHHLNLENKLFASRLNLKPISFPQP